MAITSPTTPPWLLLIFSIPSKKASARVGVWRKLQRYGALPLRNSGYVLPNMAVNQERFEWLATAIRGIRGEASVLQVNAIDDLPRKALEGQFNLARASDYRTLLSELKKVDPSAKGFETQIGRLRRRLEEIVAIDFFDSPHRKTAEEAFRMAGNRKGSDSAPVGRLSRDDYQRRLWVTRPHPGIDRASSAWLIRRFIDRGARFGFVSDPKAKPKAVPFDMYQPGGFGHEGNCCTFETLMYKFGIRDKRAALIAQAIHDADLEDDKFGRTEGITINQILQGWQKQGISDDELLRRGIDLIEGLYHSIS